MCLLVVRGIKVTVILASIQLFTIILLVLFEYHRRSLAVFLWATLLVMFGLPHTISAVTGVSQYPDYVLNEAALFVVMFNMVYFVSRIFIVGWERTRNRPIDRIGGNDVRNACSPLENRLISVSSVLLWMLLVAYFGINHRKFGSLLLTSWGSLFKMSESVYEFSGFSGFISYITTYVLFALGGVLLVHRHKNRSWPFLVTAILIGIFVLVTRNRITVLPLVTSLIIVVIQRHKVLRFKDVLKFAVIGLIIVYLVYGLWVFRHYGTFTAFADSFDFIDFNSRVFEKMLSGEGELGLRNVFYHFVMYNNQFPDFNKGHTYIRTLMVGIPTRYSFGLKPPDFARTMYRAHSGNYFDTITSTHPTLYGDCFANLHWFGILLGVFWALFAGSIDRLVTRKSVVVSTLLTVLWSCVFVIVGRGSVYNGIYIGYFGSLFITGMYCVTKVSMVMLKGKARFKANNEIRANRV
jgi:hypothetical protein